MYRILEVLGTHLGPEAVLSEISRLPKYTSNQSIIIQTHDRIV